MLCFHAAAACAGDDLTASVPPASVDVCMMVFVLSAISPEAMPRALRQVAATLRPGGQVLFRWVGGWVNGGAGGWALALLSSAAKQCSQAV